MSGTERVWRPAWPCVLGATVRILRHGGGDPTFRTDPDGTVWRGMRTPEGPATLRLCARPDLGEVHATAWGDGADWALQSVPAMLGADDDPSDFRPTHPVLRDALRHHEHWRITRTGLVMESLVPAVIEQKVTGQEAFAGFRLLVLRFGERAPGDGAERGVWVQPSPEALRLVPSWEWLRMHIDPARSKTVVRSAQVAASLERTAEFPVRRPTGGCGRCPGSGCGRAPRCASARTATPTR